MDLKKFSLMSLTVCGGLLLAACNGAEEAQSSEEDDFEEVEIGTVGAMEDFSVGDTFVATEPLDISILYRDLSAYPYDPDWMFFDVLEEEHNVFYDAVAVPLSDFEERRSVTIAAGDMPDYVTDSWPGVESEFVPSRVILPISDYVHHMPHFQDRVERWGLQ